MMRPLQTTRRVLAALGIGVSLGYLVGSCARDGANAPSPVSSGLPLPAGGAVSGSWHSLAEPQSEEARAAIEQLSARVDRMIGGVADGEAMFLAPDDLRVCARALLKSLLLGDPSSFLEELRARGAEPDPANLAAVAADFAEWRLIEPLDLEGLSANDAYRAVWETRPQRWMVVLAVRSDWVDVGRGMLVYFGRDAWDFDGVRSCVSAVVPQSGRPTPEQGETAEGTSASAHVTVRVRYSDGNEGQLRINFIFLDEQQRWYPVSITVGSEGREQWPFPFF